MVGDAELDEGNVWEALLEESSRELGNVLWIVDVNRQSLDRVVPDARRGQLAEMFRAAGWRVDRAALGPAAARAASPGPAASGCRRALEAMSNAEYQRLLRCRPARLRKALVDRRRAAASTARSTGCSPT